MYTYYDNKRGISFKNVWSKLFYEPSIISVPVLHTKDAVRENLINISVFFWTEFVNFTAFILLYVKKMCATERKGRKFFDNLSALETFMLHGQIMN